MDSTTDLTNPYPYPRNRFVRTLLRWGIGASTNILTRLKFIGREYLPKKGPLIVIANHFHFLDSVMLIWAVPWPLEFLADFEMPNVPKVLQWFPRCYQTYDVTQGTANIEALRASEAILAQAGILGIFPEGRVHSPPLKPALPGVAFLALRTGAPILPVGIYSNKDWKVLGSIIQDRSRLHVTCHFGPVFGPLACDSPRRPDRGDIQTAGVRMMEEVAKLLPLDMRGPFHQYLQNQT